MLADGAEVQVTLWWGLDAQDQTQQGGALRARWQKLVTTWAKLRAELDLEASQTSATSAGSIGSPPREGDVRAFGQPPPEQVDEDTWQVTQLGVAPWVSLGVPLEVAGFSWSSDSLTVRNGVDQPLLAQALVAAGESRSRGVQATVRATAGNWFGWVSYTLSRAERCNSPSADWRHRRSPRWWL